MSTVSQDSLNESAPAGGADPRRWMALTVLTAMQFMLVMDVTVVNIALPHVKNDLHFSYEGLAWVVNAYVLVAGGFLLLGGRLADTFGRRRMFMTGVVVFGLASIACGAATASWALVSSRFVQGFGEAFAGPAALGLIPVMFPDRAERTKALGIWGGLSALGGAVGSVIGGSVVDLVNWRWVFFINIPVALFAVIMVPRMMPESRMDRQGKRIDIAGAIGITSSLVAVVYGLLQAADHSWGSVRVLLPLLGGLAVLALTIMWESRVADPMIPLRFFKNRTRVTANVVSLASLAGFHTYAFLLTLFIQQVLGYSPLKTGLSYIPLTIGMGLGVGMSTALMPRIGVKAVTGTAFLGSAAALFVAASGLHTGASYWGGVMPGLIMFGFFNALGFPALINAALHEVTGQDSGLASGTQTAMQQIGAALGLATLVPIALRYVSSHTTTASLLPAVQSHGYAESFRVAAGILVVAGVIVLLMLEKVDTTPRNAFVEATEDVMTPAVATS